ncbi:MAG TPA: hypothetical protein VFN37_11945 [Candidatus Baltobacteraceae bacterium]|nr:hypothetical protein [Candidatus Baltobacteraceae bacterium]
MSFRYIGMAHGREIFVTGLVNAENPAVPTGYSIAAVVLPDGWKSDDLGALLNQLYGGLDDWTEFDPNAGARSFVFYGERSEEAGNLCDAFAYAWSKGVQAQYDEVIAASNDAPDVDAFVEAMLSGEIAVSDTYADKLRNVLFAVPLSDSNEGGRLDPLAERVTQAVTAAVQQHRFD